MFLLATTRWGSYALPGPPYISDLAIALLLFDRLLALPLPGHVLARNNTFLLTAVGGLVAVAVVSFLTGPITPDAVRDVAPFVYGIATFITAPLVGKRALVAGRLITLALVAHLAWSTLALAVPAVATHFVTPGNSTVYVLSLRSDVDGMVNGLAASIGLFRVLTGRKGVVFFVWGAALVLVSHSRISLITTIIILFCVVGYSVAQARRGRSDIDAVRRLSGLGMRARRRSLWVIVGAVVVIGIVVAVTSPTAVSRLGETFGLGHAATEQSHEVKGTTHSRELAWSRLEHWIMASESRTLWGAGFGPNIMSESDATIALVHKNDPDLRAPHNFFLGTWAHLGLLGLALLTLIVFLGIRLAIGIRRLPMSDVDLLAALLAIGMPLIAAVGVVMESPFGAIPFFWALGQLGSHLSLTGSSRRRAPYDTTPGEFRPAMNGADAGN
jgi:hypothetical protein